jgi:membrane-associated phospholipid phosphatase
LSTTEFAQVGAERGPRAEADPAPRAGFEHWPAVRRIGLAIYALAIVLWSANYGIPVQRELVIAWVCGALAITSLGRPPRHLLQILIDWMPIVAVLVAYDITRGAADSFGIPIHYSEMVDFDKAVFFGETPTEWLQAQLYEPDVVHWYDVAFTLTYTSYFIVPFALAGYLWARDHPAFVRFAKRLVTLALAGLATYILFPAAPPWMASEMGLLEEVHRTTAKGWEVLGIGTAGWFSKGQGLGNPVAAMPSLHTAFCALVAFFLWSRVRRRWRPLLLAYPLAMGLTLMATGEHYFLDVILGFAYAGLVMAGWGWWEKRRADPAELTKRAEPRSAES